MNKTTNTIQRQKADPVLAKACHVMRHYAKAADCLISVLDPDYNVIEVSKNQASQFFCSVCTRYCGNQCGDSASDELPCSAKHRIAVNDSQRLGGSHIYRCDLGFLFWTSPFFSGEHFAGALIGSGVLGVPEQQTMERIHKISGGEVTPKQIRRHLEAFTGKNHEDVKAMAQMMLICADQLSVRNTHTETVFSDENEKPVSNTIADIDNSRETDNEVKLLAALRRGDRDEAKKIAEEFLNTSMANGGFSVMQIRAIELTALISRAAAGSNSSVISGSQDEYDKYLKKIEETQTPEELLEIIGKAIIFLSGKMFSYHGVLHSSALRKAERFIWKNYTRKISLKEIAGAAGLSAPYFSTIFREEMGIHLSHYLNRLRVAKAAASLIETSKSINCIAEDCGFEDQSWFSKIFKSNTGVSPGKYREQGGIYSLHGWIGLKEPEKTA